MQSSAEHHHCRPSPVRRLHRATQELSEDVGQQAAAEVSPYRAACLHLLMAWPTGGLPMNVWLSLGLPGLLRSHCSGTGAVRHSCVPARPCAWLCLRLCGVLQAPAPSAG